MKVLVPIASLFALSASSACHATHATTTTTGTTSTASSSSGSGGAGGTSDAWKLLYDGTPDREPGAIALLPTGIVVEVASDMPTSTPPAKLATLPFTGGALTDIATLAPLRAIDPFSLVTDDASLGFLARPSGGDDLGIVAVTGGAPMDLVPLSAMKRAHPLVAVRAGRVYFVDDSGVESITMAGAATPFVSMPVSAATASDSHVFFVSGTAISAVPLAGGPAAHVADEASPIIAMAATGTHVYWLEDAGDGKHSTVFGADIGGAGSKILGTGEFHAIAADATGVYAFFFDGDEKAVLERIDPATANAVSIDSPFASITTLAVRSDVPYIVALGTVLSADSSGTVAYRRQVRALAR